MFILESAGEAVCDRCHSMGSLITAKRLFETSAETTARTLASRSAQLDTVFPDGREYLHETGSAKKLPNLFAEVEEF
jgi:hypothetical protein